MSFSREEVETIAHGKLKKWIKIPAFKESSGVKITDDDYFRLLDHHEKETKFLVQLCQGLAKKLIYMNSFDNMGSTFIKDKANEL